jgi:hypothetical protein
MKKKLKPIVNEEEIQQNPDEHIDQDFPGFPHLPSDKKAIMPSTKTEIKMANALPKKSGKTYGG